MQSLRFAPTNQHKVLEPITPRAVAAVSTHPEAERRQLTVMFCDLVGSTALSARLDPEDLREVIRAYTLCRRSDRQFDGFIARYMGDGVLGLFRLPGSP